MKEFLVSSLLLAALFLAVYAYPLWMMHETNKLTVEQHKILTILCEAYPQCKKEMGK